MGTNPSASSENDSGPHAATSYQRIVTIPSIGIGRPLLPADAISVITILARRGGRVTAANPGAARHIHDRAAATRR
ncbi:hypothetical protein GCM10011588_58220 [Nocardia jinanensis]|uniref:Uncharacterized protein n=1 Tax=Nocardia jinanensis TaxID=382504 RepID=A0A917RWG3_9NOCA|nr:hypothetical protein GCM10011588_58220 [Nocardia jinanensis]